MPIYTEEELSDSFEESLSEGTVQDLLGNPLAEKDFITIDPEKKGEAILIRALAALKTFQGKTLTIIDATYDDKERAKHVKSLLKAEFSKVADSILEIISDHTEVTLIK